MPLQLFVTELRHWFSNRNNDVLSCPISGSKTNHPMSSNIHRASAANKSRHLFERGGGYKTKWDIIEVRQVL